MNTVLFETKEDYISYCKEKNLISIIKAYVEKHIKFDGGKECHIKLEDNYFIDSEPFGYPCIFVWTIDPYDYIEGTFIYPRDFELMKRYGI